ncbi:glycosyltransferase [Vibrio owensii]
MILALLPLGNLTNGAAIISNEISKIINMRVVDVSLNSKNIIHAFYKLLKSMVYIVFLSFKYKNVYFCLTTNGVIFYRDMFLLLFLLIIRRNVTLHIHNNYRLGSLNFVFKFLMSRCKIITINSEQYSYYSRVSESCFMQKNTLPNQSRQNEVKKDEKIIFMSRITEKKGFSRLFYLADILVDYEFFVAGAVDDNLKHLFGEEIRARNNMHFLGFIDENEKEYHLATSKIILQLSDDYYEAAPLVYLEAMMNKLFVVSTNQYAFDDLVKSYGVDFKDLIGRNDPGLYLKELMNKKSQINYDSNFDFHKYCQKLNDIIDR